MTVSSVISGRQDSTTTWLGVLIFVAAVGLFVNTVMVPRFPVNEREFLHAMHFSLGLTVLVLVALRFVHLRRNGSVRAPENMPAAAFGFSRMVLSALLLTFSVTALIGFAYAWSNGHHVTIYGITLPQMVPKTYEMRTLTGYFHSALGFYYMGVVVLWLAVGLFHHARYRCGLLRLLPGSRV